MKHTDEVTVTVAPERIKLYERAMEIGLPSIVVSMYGSKIQKLIDDEREACAKVCEELFQVTPPYTTYAEAAQDCADAIRARGTNHG
jgi:hypothetical protein